MACLGLPLPALGVDPPPPGLDLFLLVLRTSRANLSASFHLAPSNWWGGFVVVFTLLLKFRHVFSPHVGFFSLFLGVLYFGYLFLNLNEVFMVSPSLIPVGYL